MERRLQRGSLNVRLIVVFCCLTIVLHGFIATVWYTRQPPTIRIGTVRIVNHNHTPNVGFSTVQETTIDPDSWSVRQPRIYNDTVRVVNHNHTPNVGVQKATIDPAITRETSNNQTKLGYLVVVDIPEQLISGLENLVQLYMINQLHWKLGMIEPYVLGTWLSLAPPTREDFKSQPLLSTYLNRSHMMHNLKECFHSDVKLSTFQDLLINAARSFIVLKFDPAKNAAKDISECSSWMVKTKYILNYHLQRVKDRAMAVHGWNYRFVGVGSLCIRSHPQKPFSMLQVVEYVKQWMMKHTSGQLSEPFPPQYTVVIPEWRSILSRPTGHYYYDPSFTAFNFTDSCQLMSVPHTSFVTNTASKVLNTLALPGPLIAFHVRSERVAWMDVKYHVEGFTNKCMAMLPKVLEAVQRKYNVSRDHIIFIHDGTKYGSTSFYLHNKRPLSTLLISKIQALGIRNVQYKPLHNTHVDFAAPQFVEQEILLSADVLILVGSGDFQRSLLARFRSKVKGGDKWYKMCSMIPQEDHLQELDL